jgi:hypothetical protein
LILIYSIFINFYNKKLKNYLLGRCTYIDITYQIMTDQTTGGQDIDQDGGQNAGHQDGNPIQQFQPTPTMIDRANDALLTGFLGLIIGLRSSGPNAHLVHELIARVVDAFPGGFEEVTQNDPNDLEAMQVFTRRACNQASLTHIIHELNSVQRILQVMTPHPRQALAGLDVLSGQVNVALTQLNPIAVITPPI